MFTGYISHAEMEEEHALELEAIGQGRVETGADAVSLRRRQQIFVPVAAVVTALLLVGLYFFVTYEQTAIATVPRVEVFLPATPIPEEGH
jgi:hypothetical protein